MTRPNPGDEQLASAIDEHLRRRIAEAVGAAERLLGLPADGAPPDERRLRPLTLALTERLASEGGDAAARDAQDAHEAQLERLRRRFADRANALERVQAAISRLREITSPATMLQRAAAALSDSSQLDRVIVSTVRDGVMTAEAVQFRGDPAGARAALDGLRAQPLRLEHPLIETEALRRPRAIAVTRAQVHARVDRRMAEIMGWDSYVAAAVTVRGRAIALIHADRGPTQSLDVLQRDVLWAFASGLAQAYESASLRRTLRHEREQMRQFLAWLDARSGELSDAAIQLVPAEPRRPPQPAPREPGAARGRDDSAAFEGVLTRRELEVLRLLAQGRTNRAIADELVISSGTVKFHVNGILRKLRVANRAEAVTRYYALRGTRRHER